MTLSSYAHPTWKKCLVFQLPRHHIYFVPNAVSWDFSYDTKIFAFRIPLLLKVIVDSRAVWSWGLKCSFQAFKSLDYKKCSIVPHALPKKKKNLHMQSSHTCSWLWQPSAQIFTVSQMDKNVLRDIFPGKVSKSSGRCSVRCGCS